MFAASALLSPIHTFQPRVLAFHEMNPCGGIEIGTAVAFGKELSLSLERCLASLIAGRQGRHSLPHGSAAVRG